METEYQFYFARRRSMIYWHQLGCTQEAERLLKTGPIDLGEIETRRRLWLITQLLSQLQTLLAVDRRRESLVGPYFTN